MFLSFKSDYYNNMETLGEPSERTSNKKHCRDAVLNVDVPFDAYSGGGGGGSRSERMSAQT